MDTRISRTSSILLGFGCLALLLLSLLVGAGVATAIYITGNGDEAETEVGEVEPDRQGGSAVTPRPPAVATAVPQSSRVAFISGRDGEHAIHVVDLDGTGLKRLTSEPGVWGRPLMSPNGEHVAFRAEGQLWVVTVASGDLRPISSADSGLWDPVSWSPDASRLAVVVDGNIVIVGINGEVPMQLSSGGNADWLDWSADGRHIAYVVEHDRYDQDVMVIDVSDGSSHKLYDGTRVTGIDWSPAGDQLAIIERGDDNRGGGEILVIGLSGDEPRQITSEMHAYKVAWSPDGTRIVFANFLEDNGDIYLVNPDGSGLERLTSDPAFETSPTWSADGQEIVFESGPSRKMVILVLNLSSGIIRPLTDGQNDDYYPST